MKFGCFILTGVTAFCIGSSSLAGEYTILHQFNATKGNDGAIPKAGLVTDGAVIYLAPHFLAVAVMVALAEPAAELFSKFLPMVLNRSSIVSAEEQMVRTPMV